MRQDASGGTVGICVFPDGSECEEWAYFRGECKPGDSLNLQPTMIPSPQPTSYNWKQYRDEALGFSFQYPPDTEIVMDDNPTKSISIVGMQKEGDRWPFITISYPSDRAEYRPPEGADLLQWLTDHNLLGESRVADVEIAGTTAIHLRHERSPQSYAYDRYYFAKSGQLYMIVIGHTGDREDWVLYEHFLYTITFD
jgi:hypothetical protein